MPGASIHIDAIDTAVSRTAGIWVPSERVSIHRLPRPTAPRRKWRQLLPWLLEEQVLSPVETLHIVMLAEEEDSLLVAAISHADMQSWLTSIETAGLIPQVLLPDYLALPWQAGELSLALRQPSQTNGAPRVVVRYGQWQGFAATPDRVPALLAALEHAGASIGEPTEARVEESAGEPLRRVFYMRPEQIPDELKQAAADCREAINWQQPLPASANLLQGDYATKPGSGYLSAWWPVAALLLVAVGLGWGTLAVANRSLSNEIMSLDQSRMSWFHTLFPDAVPLTDNAVYPARPAALPSAMLATHRSIETLVQQRFAQRERMQGSAMAVMVALDPVLSRCDCELSALQVDETGAELLFEGGNGNANGNANGGESRGESRGESGDLDTLLSQLAPLPGHDVSISERSTERLRLQVQRGEQP